jgi:cation diffusion facilitator family transporter
MNTPTKAEKIAEKVIYFSILSSASLAIIKWLVGYFGNSYALIADAIESTGDIFASVIVMLGMRYANKPADNKYPYGYGRAEPLITFLVVGFLIISATIIAHQSIINIQTPHESPEPYTLFILGVIILVKEISYRFTLRKSKQTHSSSLKADAWHHRSDALTSLAAFIGILMAVIFGKGYETADDWAALLASGFILYNSYLIFRPAFKEIMDENSYDELVREIRTIASQQIGIISTEKCFVRKSGMRFFIDLHIIVNKDITVKEGHDIAHQLKDTLKNKMPQIADILIHVEPNR